MDASAGFQTERRGDVMQWRNAGARVFVNADSAHAGVEVAWPIEGRLTYEVGPRRFEVTCGAVMVVPSNVGHVTRVEPCARVGSVLLSAERIDEAAELFGRASDAAAGAIEGRAQLTALCALLHREAWSRGSDPMAIEALEDAIACELHRASAASRRRAVDPRIRRAIDCVESRFAEPLTLTDLAKAAAMSRFHFSRSFREQLGMSPYRYLVVRRLARGRALLEGGAPVADVATAVGFRDVGRFSKAFCAEFAVTPRSVARATATRATATTRATDRSRGPRSSR